MSTTLKKYTLKPLTPFIMLLGLLGFLGLGSLALPDTGLNVGTVAVAHADDCKVLDKPGNKQGCWRGSLADEDSSPGKVYATGSTTTEARLDATQGEKRVADEVGITPNKGAIVRHSPQAAVTTCAGDLINGGYAGGLASGAMDLGPSFDFTYAGPNVKC